MNPLHPSIDSGCESTILLSEENNPLAPIESPLRKAVRTGLPKAVEAAIRHLASPADARPLTSAQIAEALLDPHGGGDSILHLACRPDRSPGVLEALLSGIEWLVDELPIESRELAVMLRAVDQENESAMQLLAGAPDSSGLERFGNMLIDLRKRNALSGSDLAALLLHRSHNETPLQMALRRGSPAAVATVLQLWAQALSLKDIDASEVALALVARRSLAPSRPGAAPGSPPRPILIEPFASADMPVIQAIIRGIDALREIGRMPDELLQNALSPALDATNSGLLDCSATQRDRRDAQALVNEARARWGI